MPSPRNERPVPVQCPSCHQQGARLLAHSDTVLTVACLQCGHQWAMPMADTPEGTRKILQVILLERAMSKEQ
jgi:Zn ribbon nucleic-acid-binding protein